MKKMVWMSGLICGASFCMVSALHAAPQTVLVDCAKGGSIARALATEATELDILVSGVCVEAVIVNRDLVTLRGSDPSFDGIQAPPGQGYALVLRDTRYARIQNLTISGGSSSAMTISHTGPYGREPLVDDYGINLENCRIMGSTAGTGVFLDHSAAHVVDTTFSENAEAGAFVYFGELVCHRCTFVNNGGPDALEQSLLVAQGRAFLYTSSITGYAPVSITNGRLILSNTTVTETGGEGAAAISAIHSRVQVTGGSIAGRLSFSEQTYASLRNVTQTAGVSGDGTWAVRAASFTMNGSTGLAGNVVLQDFSNATMKGSSTVSGDLNCEPGSNVYCQSPVAVSGSSSCSLCRK